MKCIDCEHYQDTCVLEKIYASGYLRKCPYLGKPEPIIPPSGGNLQIMAESIRVAEGLERVDITPVADPQNGGYYGKIMLCYGGKGVELLSDHDNTLPAAAVYFGWSAALQRICDHGPIALKRLIPLIERRLRFDYSVVKYVPISKREAVIRPVVMEEQKEKKRPGLVKPASEEKLLTVDISNNGEKADGDQLDLFAC